MFGDPFQFDTFSGGKTHATSGYISWTPIPDGQEFQKESYGQKVWAYRMRVSAALSASVWVDKVQGIPAPRAVGQEYEFPFSFLSRPMLCGKRDSQEYNRVDYGMANTVDVWNGDDSSAGDGKSPLYFGSADLPLTAACEVYNRLGSSIYTFAIFCKARETYILHGYDAETFKIYPVSVTQGCPAPLTMDTYQETEPLESGSIRSIAMWLSHQGPVMFDAGGLKPVPGIECYFDRNDARCVNHAVIVKAAGWFDPDWPEYNLLLPSGSSATANNVWLVYNLKFKQWIKKVPLAAASAYPQFACRVADSEGRPYAYGFRDNGYMMRLEYGNTWDGVDNAMHIDSADILPTNDIWDVTELRRLKALCKSITEDDDISITYWADGDDGVGAALPTVVAMNGANRFVKSTQALNKMGWSHRFRFAAATGATPRGMQLIGWGFEFIVRREDI